MSNQVQNSKSKIIFLEKTLLLVLRAGVALTLFTLFLLFKSTFFPFIVGKMIVFQILVELLFVVYLALILVNPKWRPRFSILMWSVILFLIANGLSIFFGIDPTRSFWSVFERMTGFFALLHYFALFVIVSAVFRNWADVRQLLQIAVFLAVAQAFICLAQFWGSPVYLSQGGGGRVWGSLGNFIYIGGYFLFHIFFAILLGVEEKRFKWKLIYFLAALFQVLVLFYTHASKGSILAFGFSSFVLLLFYVYFWRRKVFGLILVFALCLGVALWFLKDASWAANVPVFKFLREITFESGTGRTRLIAWEIAFKGFLERPVFGWGPENFYSVFNKFYNPESLLYGYYETWFDRSHNVFLDILATTGSIGFLSYSFIFVVLLIYLIKIYRQKLISRHFMFFVGAVFLAYLAQNFFVFDNPSSYLLFFLSLGIVAGMGIGEAKVKEASPCFAFSAVLFLAILFLLPALALVFVNIKNFRTAKNILLAEKVARQDLVQGANFYKGFLAERSPYRRDSRLGLGRYAAGLTRTDPTTPSPTSETVDPNLLDFLLFARNELANLAKETPWEIQAYSFLAQINTFLGTVSDPIYFREANEAFEKVKIYSPKRQQIFFSQAKLKILEKDLDGAIALLEEAARLEPRSPDSNWYLGLAYKAAGEKEKALERFRAVWGPAQKTPIPYSWKSPYEILFLANFMEEEKQWQDAVIFYIEAIKQFSENAELYLKVAELYPKIKEKEKIDYVNNIFKMITIYLPPIREKFKEVMPDKLFLFQ